MIEEDIRTGEFADADDAIREAIPTQQERIALRQSLLKADAAMDRGEFITPEEARARSAKLLDDLKHPNG